MDDALLVGFMAAQVWSDSDKAHTAVNREAGALRDAVLISTAFPEAEHRFRALIRQDGNRITFYGHTEQGAEMALAIADQNAVFGLSEINWGVIPGGVVSKAISTLMGDREALYYVMTGEQFNGARAVEVGLVNEAVPAGELKQRTTDLAQMLLKKNPTVLRQARLAYKYAREMSWEQASEYLTAKSDQTNFVDPEKGKEQGLKQFLDQKSFRPGHGAYTR